MNGAFIKGGFEEEADRDRAAREAVELMRYRWQQAKRELARGAKTRGAGAVAPRKERVKRERRAPLPDPVEEHLVKVAERVRARHVRGGLGGEPIDPLYLVGVHAQQAGCCFYTGIRYVTNSAGPIHLVSPLQAVAARVDSTKGWVAGNVVLCCWFVSRAKHTWDIEEMKRLWSRLPTLSYEDGGAGPVHQ